MGFRRMTRGRIALAAILLLLLLDLGRSVLVRTAMTEPVSRWQSDPKLYADMPWPPAAAAPVTATAAQKLYFEHCALCHGPDGRGNGPAAASMIPRPRDFTQGLAEYKSTPAGSPPSDDDLYATIADGLGASAMPGWKDILTPEQIRDLAGVVRTMSPGVAQAGAPVVIPPRPAVTGDSVARGRQIYADAGCAACHGDDLRGGKVLEDAKGYPVVSRDLTAPWTFRGGSAPDRIWLRLTTGLAPGPMPSYAQTLDPGQRWDLVAYVLASGRTAPWAPGGALQGPGDASDLGRPRALSRPRRDVRPVPHRDRHRRHLSRGPLPRRGHARRRSAAGRLRQPQPHVRPRHRTRTRHGRRDRSRDPRRARSRRAHAQLLGHAVAVAAPVRRRRRGGDGGLSQDAAAGPQRGSPRRSTTGSWRRSRASS